jgi:hypothetical protein
MNIFIAKDGERLGPFTQTEIKDQVRSAQLTLNDFAWHEGCASWTRLCEMTELVNSIIPELPPPVGQVNQAASTELPPLSGSQVVQSTVAAPPKLSESLTNRTTHINSLTN